MLSRFAVAALVALLPYVEAGPYYKLNRRSTGVSVELAQAGATEVKATLTNTGDEAVHLLTLGGIFDDAPVQKLSVFQNGQPVEYTGLLYNFDVENLPDDGFVTLEAGESTDTIINIATIFDLSGGEYTVSVTDAIPFAPVGSKELSGVVEFESNVLTLTIAEDAIASVAQAIPKLLDRTILASTCTGTQGTALRNALTRVVSQARNAGSAASSGNAAKFNEYFRTTASGTRSSVAARFNAIATEASSTTSGRTNYYCTDILGACRAGVIAYTQPATNRIANCSPFYSLRAVSTGCGQQSQAATVLHEFTHAPGIYSPGTDDHAYGYAASIRLSAAQAVQNADTYALYADAILNGC